MRKICVIGVGYVGLVTGTCFGDLGHQVTCVDGGGGEVDLKYVRAAAQGIAEVMDHPLIIINKSTVPIGTGDWVSDIVRRNQNQPIPFSVVSCPEFLREGSAIGDCMQP